MPISPASADSSAPVSPAFSSFSLSRSQPKFSSSVSSLVSPPPMGISMERTGSLPIQLREVKEENCNRPCRILENDYFEGYFVDQLTGEPHEMVNDDHYLAGNIYNIDYAARQRSESLSSRGLPRFGSTISSMSSRWKSKRSFDSDGSLMNNLRSRASSTSSAMRKTASSDGARPPHRLSQESTRLSNRSLGAIDIEKANRASMDEEAELPVKPSTPLLPPMLDTYQPSAPASGVASPLQSPSVADVSELNDFPVIPSTRSSTHRSPPLSTMPSMTSLNRARGATIRTISGEGVPPLVISEGDDEWASKLGHANFTIHPEPYIPEALDAFAFQRFQEDWQLARCNYAKHLVRTGEHYGETSMIYQFTKDKLDSIEAEWKRNFEPFAANDARLVATLSTTKQDMACSESVKIPHLYNNEKFPELGDEEIVGPMTVAPAPQSPTRSRSPRRRNVFQILHDLVNRTQPQVTAAHA
ncbi:hypothetical protein PISL3812_02453 [Talaromyces islandicus]|uniref:Only prolin and serin are matching in the corresponding protein n=1 Tax=Talaromyces islandicus TaxID=28573 RepID=A0A0U1LQA2_TALIS|nr:hypothetical protein PISL3812_02453 [Talaromyces islandicus]